MCSETTVPPAPVLRGAPLTCVNPADRVLAGGRESAGLYDCQYRDPQVHQVHHQGEWTLRPRGQAYDLERIHETADPPLVANIEAKLDALRFYVGRPLGEAEDSPCTATMRWREYQNRFLAPRASCGLLA